MITNLLASQFGKLLNIEAVGVITLNSILHNYYRKLIVDFFLNTFFPIFVENI